MTVSRISLADGGPELSRIVFGLWRLGDWKLDRAATRRLVESCIDLGVTSFDHADIYGEYACEQLFGDAVGGDRALRQKMQIVTKCGIKLVSARRPGRALPHYDTSREHIVSSVEASLKALGTDYVDLLLIHRPDPLMDADEVAEAFGALRDEGKVRHFGVSNFTPAQYALLSSRVELVTNQIELSVLHTAPLFDGTLDECQRLRVRPMAWSPFGGGRLFRHDDPLTAQVRDQLASVGAALGGASIDQVALAWILAHPARVAPVLGTGNLDRVQAAVAAASLPLTREQWFLILRAAVGADVP